MTGQGIPDENAPTLIRHNVKIEANIPDLKLTFHIVSPEQIDAYTEMGILFDLAATFLGIAIGAAVGFWTALKQGGLSPQSIATINTALLASIIFGIVSAIGAIWFFYRKMTLKRQWRTSTFPSDNK